MAPGLSLSSVIAVLILNTESGERIFAKYYSAPHHAPGTTAPSIPYPDLKAQKAFEKGLASKTLKSTNDISLYDNRVVLYKLEGDVVCFESVAGGTLLIGYLDALCGGGPG